MVCSTNRKECEIPLQAISMVLVTAWLEGIYIKLKDMDLISSLGGQQTMNFLLNFFWRGVGHNQYHPMQHANISGDHLVFSHRCVGPPGIHVHDQTPSPIPQPRPVSSLAFPYPSPNLRSESLLPKALGYAKTHWSNLQGITFVYLCIPFAYNLSQNQVSVVSIALKPYCPSNLQYSPQSTCPVVQAFGMTPGFQTFFQFFMDKQPLSLLQDETQLCCTTVQSGNDANGLSPPMIRSHPAPFLLTPPKNTWHSHTVSTLATLCSDKGIWTHSLCCLAIAQHIQTPTVHRDSWARNVPLLKSHYCQLCLPVPSQSNKKGLSQQSAIRQRLGDQQAVCDCDVTAEYA